MIGYFSNYPTQAIINDVLEHLDKHKLHTVISKVFSLHEIGHTHKFMEKDIANGKVIVSI